MPSANGLKYSMNVPDPAGTVIGNSKVPVWPGATDDSESTAGTALLTQVFVLKRLFLAGDLSVAIFTLFGPVLYQVVEPMFLALITSQAVWPGDILPVFREVVLELFVKVACPAYCQR